MLHIIRRNPDLTSADRWLTRKQMQSATEEVSLPSIRATNAQFYVPTAFDKASGYVIVAYCDSVVGGDKLPKPEGATEIRFKGDEYYDPRLNQLVKSCGDVVFGEDGIIYGVLDSLPCFVRAPAASDTASA